MDALDGRVRGSAVDHGLIGDADEDAVGGDDGEVARDVAHRVVLGRETRGREHAGVGAGAVHPGVGTGNRRAARDIGQGVGAEEAAEADAVEVGRVEGGDEFRVIVHGDPQSGRGDVGRQTGRSHQRVVAGTDATEGITTDRDGLGRTDVLVGERRVRRADNDRAIARARERGDSRRAGEGGDVRRIVDLADRGDAGDRDRQRGDVGRGGLTGGQDVVAGETRAIG